MMTFTMITDDVILQASMSLLWLKDVVCGLVFLFKHHIAHRYITEWLHGSTNIILFMEIFLLC